MEWVVWMALILGCLATMAVFTLALTLREITKELRAQDKALKLKIEHEKTLREDLTAVVRIQDDPEKPDALLLDISNIGDITFCVVGFVFFDKSLLKLGALDKTYDPISSGTSQTFALRFDQPRKSDIQHILIRLTGDGMEEDVLVNYKKALDFYKFHK